MSDPVARAKAALESVGDGPWAIDSEDGEPIIHEAHHYDSADEWYDVDSPNGGWVAHCEDLPVAEFIAAARTLIPELVAEVERLRPRGVETTADLEWLPENSVILTHDGGALQKTSRGSWYWANDDQDESLPEDLIDFLPARVLYIPTDSLEEA
ncbi:hypothetical protein SEA_FUSHIGI_74 [Mycobacterium phage Fushigi]|nr:hypothetical protein SEA_FUSHIGI_74 [Mycobacterium phage Fushigi]